MMENRRALLASVLRQFRFRLSLFAAPSPFPNVASFFVSLLLLLIFPSKKKKLCALFFREICRR